MLFPSTSNADLLDADDDDWQHVMRLGYIANIHPCEDWASRLYEIMNDMMLTSTMVDPDAEDADWWVV
jgi:hypothetical protein